MKKLIYRGCSYVPASNNLGIIKRKIKKKELLHEAQLSATKNGKFCDTSN